MSSFLPSTSGFRRRIWIGVKGDSADAGEARAVLEDDFHHFRVAVLYRDGIVSGTAVDALRVPFTSCPFAAGQLDLLQGMQLDDAADRVFQQTDPSQQCTHMLDLAGLAIAAAARGTPLRRYDIHVADRQERRTTARLWRNGQHVLTWHLDGFEVVGPDPFTGVELRQGFGRWVRERMDSEEAEACLVLRRCAVISMGRGVDLDAIPTAVARGRCFSEQPDRAPQALRVRGSTLDFTERERELGQGDQGWAKFE